MAHKLTVSDENLITGLNGRNFLWANTKHVGYGYSNDHLDVRLVQFLLNGYSKSVKAGHELLVCDGSFGGKTWARLKWYQKRYSGDIVADGAVSPMTGGTGLTPKQGMIFTIVQLNVDYAWNWPAYYDDIRRDIGCPNELVNHFSSPRIHTQNNLRQLGLGAHG